MVVTRSNRFALWGAAGLPWLFIWQGLDFTDQGYLLTGYRCFFRHPEATEESGHMWLTNLVGALWDALFGWLGVVGMRALWALTMSLCIVLAFRLARSLTTERAAALAVLVSSVFLSDRHATWFSYNSFSTLIFAAVAVRLCVGIWQNRPRWLFAAGVGIGLAPFARFPNVLGVGVLSALGFAALIAPERRRQVGRDLGVALLGVLAGAGGTLALIIARGDLQLYLAAVGRLFLPSVQGERYALPSLLHVFLQDQGMALAWGLAACAAAVGLARVLHWKPALASVLLPLAGGLGTFSLAYKAERWRWIVPGCLYLLLGGLALGVWKRRFEVRVSAFILLVIVLIAPLGSDRGIKNAHMGLWVALPFALAVLQTLDTSWLWGQASRLALAVSLALVGEGVYRAVTYTYRDSGNRLALRASVHDPQLRAQFTTPERARSVEQVLAALESRVSPGDYLLAYEGTPLLQYLTDTRPYLNRPWLMGWETGKAIAPLTVTAPARTGCLAVAVATTKSTRGSGWPLHPEPLERGEPQRGERAALTAFLRKHGYERTWTNGFFEILEPPASERGHCR